MAQRWVGEVKHLVFYASTVLDLLCCPEGCCRDYTFRGRPCLGVQPKDISFGHCGIRCWHFYNTLVFAEFGGRSVIETPVNLCICCRLLDHLLGLNLSTANF